MKEVTLSLFVGDIILFIENPKKNTHKIRMNLTSLQDSRSLYKNAIVFPYINNKQSKNKMKKVIQFIIASKRIK